MIMDFEHEAIEFELADGQHLRVPNGQPYAPEHGLRRIIYDFSSRTAKLDLVHSGQVVAEIGGFPDEAHRAGRLIVYLDQNHWITLARYVHSRAKLSPSEHDASARLFALARDQKIILPLSGAHMTETDGARLRYRQHLVPLMLELSRGWQMRSPLRVRRDELYAAFQAFQHGAAIAPRPAVFSLEPEVAFAPGHAYQSDESDPELLPPELADLNRRLLWITVLCSTMLDEEEPTDVGVGHKPAISWAAAHQHLAQHIRDSPVGREQSRALSFAHIVRDMKDDLAFIAATVGLTRLQFEEWLHQHAEDAFGGMPYVGTVREATHLRLRNAGDVWTDHDLNDLHYLACATAYADAIACERKAADYLSRAWRGREGGAPIFKTLVELVDYLNPLLTDQTRT